jgi:hypothetical protein
MEAAAQLCVALDTPAALVAAPGAEEATLFAGGEAR